MTPLGYVISGMCLLACLIVAAGLWLRDGFRTADRLIAAAERDTEPDAADLGLALLAPDDPRLPEEGDQP